MAFTSSCAGEPPLIPHRNSATPPDKPPRLEKSTTGAFFPANLKMPNLPGSAKLFATGDMEKNPIPCKVSHKLKFQQFPAAGIVSPKSANGIAISMLQVSPAVFDAARIPELFHDRHSAGSGSAAESADDQKKRHALKQLFNPAAFMRNDTLTVEHAAAAAAAGTPARSGQQPRLLRQSRPLETGGIAV